MPYQIAMVRFDCIIEPSGLAMSMEGAALPFVQVAPTEFAFMVAAGTARGDKQVIVSSAVGRKNIDVRIGESLPVANPHQYVADLVAATSVNLAAAPLDEWTEIAQAYRDELARLDASKVSDSEVAALASVISANIDIFFRPKGLCNGPHDTLARCLGGAVSLILLADALALPRILSQVLLGSPFGLGAALLRRHRNGGMSIT